MCSTRLRPALVATTALELTTVHRTIRAGVAGCHAAVRVLRGVSLEVGCGEVVGVVGDEGAGKTTLLLCAAGLLRPDEGGVAWPAAEGSIQRRLAFVPARPRFYARLTAREVAMSDASAENDADVEGVLESLGLRRVADVTVGSLSGDSRCRLGVARAVASGARILLLDEPFSGAAGGAAICLRAALRWFARGGGSVLLTSRRRGQLDAVATRVMSLRDGMLDVADGVVKHSAAARRPARRVAEDGPTRSVEGEPGIVDPPERRS